VCVVASRYLSHRFDDQFYFFFQAEDGIRDRTVTGVQTCALPIYSSLFSPAGVRLARRLPTATDPCGQITYATADDSNEGQAIGRSEERRVGKECRSRWSREQCKKKSEKIVRLCGSK